MKELWRATAAGATVRKSVSGSTVEVVAHIPDGPYRKGRANLIAASPEMHEALLAQDMYDQVAGTPTLKQWWDALDHYFPHLGDRFPDPAESERVAWWGAEPDAIPTEAWNRRNQMFFDAASEALYEHVRGVRLAALAKARGVTPPASRNAQPEGQS